MSTETEIHEDVEEAAIEIASPTLVLDAIALIASRRNYFDRAEVDAFIVQLDEKGLRYPENTDLLVTQCERRMFVSGMFVMDTMLDIRNLISPPITPANLTLEAVDA